MPQTTGSTTQATSGRDEPQPTDITPQMVRQVADRVYALWLRDLRIEQERKRPLARHWPWRGG